MQTYFADCVNNADIKKRYKELCLKHHPDKGGDTATMQAINIAYAQAMNGHFTSQGMSSKDIQDEMNVEAEFIERISSLACCDGIDIELIGRWIWVTGATYPIKDRLKTSGFFWASAKKAWYYRHEKDAVSNRKKMSLEEIREKYGSKKITPVSRYQLA